VKDKIEKVKDLEAKHENLKDEMRKQMEEKEQKLKETKE